LLIFLWLIRIKEIMIPAIRHDAGRAQKPSATFAGENARRSSSQESLNESYKKPWHAVVEYLAHRFGTDTCAQSWFSGLGTLRAIIGIAAGALIIVGR
jgi:hypothetical protein